MKKIAIALMFILPFCAIAQTDPLTPSLTPEQQEVYDALMDMIGQSGASVNPNTGLPQGFQESLDVKVSPEIPVPGEQMQISLESFSINLAASQIQWQQDGKVVASGFGVKSIVLTAPQSGESTTFIITISKNTGGVIERTVTISPSAVYLTYEARTYTPPFYKGNSLFTSESRVIFSAIPEFVNDSGVAINPSGLNYTWSINGSVISAASGVGKNSMQYEGSVVQRPMVVSVEVSSLDENKEGSAKVLLVPQSPSVLMYEENPVLGVIFEQAAVGSFTLERDEVSVIAVPYFFDVKYLDDPSLEFNWSVGQGRVDDVVGHSLTLRNTLGESGSASVSVNATHVQKILQSAGSNLRLMFGEVANSFSF